MFGVHWSSVSGDITYLIFHGTSQDHMTEYYVKLWISVPSLMLYHHPAQVVSHKHCGSADIMF